MHSLDVVAERHRVPSVLRARPWVALVVVLVVVAAVRALAVPQMVDAVVYRMGAASLLAGEDRLYELTAPGAGLPFTYPPFAALVAVPLALVPARLDSLLVGLLILACLGRVAWLVLHATGRREPTAMLLLGAWAAWLLEEPGRATFGYGQVSTILAWLVCEDLLGRGRGSRWQGIGIGMATGIKLVPGVAVLLLLCVGRWRAAAVATAATLVTIVGGWVVAPQSSLDFWTGTGFQPARIGGVAFAGNQSINGELWRLEGAGGSKVLWLLMVVVVLAASGWLARRLWRADDEVGALLVAMLAGLLCSPISWTHHWIWLGPLSWWLWHRSAAAELPSALRLAGRALAVSIAVVALLGVVMLVPHGGGLEGSWSAGQMLAGNAYVLLAFASLIWMAQIPPGHTAAQLEGRTLLAAS